VREQTPRALSSAKQALLRALLREARLSGWPRVDGVTLSPNQQRLWRQADVIDDASVFNVVSATRMRGRLDTDAILRSLTTLVERHEALRFRFEDGAPPTQRVATGGPWPIVLEESHCAEAARASAARTLVDEEGTRVLRLDRELPFRMRLVRFAPDDHVLVITAHHIVCDFWSMSLLRSEFAELYPALAAARPSPLPPLETQFYDAVAFEHMRLASGALEEQIAVALADLRAHPPAVTVARSRSSHRAHVTFDLSDQLTAAVDAFARQRGLTRFIVLLAALAILLREFAATDDVALLAPLAGRERLEFERVFGFFANVIPIRTQVRDELSVAEFAESVRHRVATALRVREVPFPVLEERILREGTALGFHGMLSVVGYPRPSSQLAAQSQEIPVWTARRLLGSALEVYNPESVPVDVCMSCTGTGRVVGALEFNVPSMTDGYARAFLDAFESALERCVVEPNTSVRDVRIQPRDRHLPV